MQLSVVLKVDRVQLLAAHEFEFGEGVNEPLFWIWNTLHDLLFFVHAEEMVFLCFVNNFSEFLNVLGLERISTPLDGCVKFAFKFFNDLDFALEHDL